MGKKMTNKQNTTGFTLIELIVIIVIIGILSIISVSTYTGFIEKARLARARASYAQIKELFITQNASTENNLFTAWYKFDMNGDVNNSSPYIIDRSEAGNNLDSSIGSGTFSQSSDTGTGVGKSFRTNNRRLKQIAPHYGEPSNKITMATWIKFLNDEPDPTYPFFVSSSAGFRVYAKNGQISFYINRQGDAVNSPTGLVERNKWYYIVASYNGDTQVMKLWVDGQLVGTTENVLQTVSFQGTGSPGSGGIHLGYEWSLPYYNGWLDETMMFPYAFDGKDLK